MIVTPVASELTKEIFLDRFRKEIVSRYRFSLASKQPVLPCSTGNASPLTDEEAQKIRPLLRARIAVGFNECTRLLEHSCAAIDKGGGAFPTGVASPIPSSELVAPPLLMVVCAEGLRPGPTVLVHIPVLARRLKVPLLLLPGAAADCDLGRLLQVHRATVLALLPRSRSPTREVAANLDDGPVTTPLEEQMHNDVDSFVNFIVCKL